MSSSNSSDPRLLLPEWLRDGDVPASAQIAVDSALTAPTVRAVEVEQIVVAEPVIVAIATPFSDRLSLDTRLDPDQLISAADLPKWLGGLERLTSVGAPQAVPASLQAAPAVTIIEPDLYDQPDAPEDGVIDVQVNGWILVAAAFGLVILLAAALRLYLS